MKLTLMGFPCGPEGAISGTQQALGVSLKDISDPTTALVLALNRLNCRRFVVPPKPPPVDEVLSWDGYSYFAPHTGLHPKGKISNWPASNPAGLLSVYHESPEQEKLDLLYLVQTLRAYVHA